MSKEKIVTYISIGIIALLTIASYTLIPHLGYDNPVEQLTEKLIEFFWGVSIDLTPLNN